MKALARAALMRFLTIIGCVLPERTREPDSRWQNLMPKFDLPERPTDKSTVGTADVVQGLMLMGWKGAARYKQ
jgi:hypothetical protein